MKHEDLIGIRDLKKKDLFSSIENSLLALNRLDLDARQARVQVGPLICMCLYDLVLPKLTVILVVIMTAILVIIMTAILVIIDCYSCYYNHCYSCYN